MVVKYFEDFAEGEVIETPTRTVTEADVVNFAGVSGDFYPLHTDEDFAKKSMFGARVAHGLLIVAIASGLWMRSGVFEGSILALYGIDRLRFLSPVYIGDSAKVKVTVIGKEDRGSNGLISLKNEVINQRGQVTVMFEAMLLLKKRTG